MRRQREIAVLTGVAPSTVSRVLRNQPGISAALRSRVLEAAKAAGLLVEAGGLAQAPALSEVMLVAPMGALGGAQTFFYHDIVDALRRRSERAGLSFTVKVVDPRVGIERTIASLPMDSPRIGVVAMGLDDHVLYEALASCGSPAVLLNALDETYRVDSVVPANWAGGRIAAQHLLALQHESVAIASTHQRRTIQLREAGCLEALRAAGIPAAASPPIDLPEMSSEAAYDAVSAFLCKDTDVTAIFCASDVVAVGALAAAAAVGRRVPEDISIVGFDDLAIGAHAATPLTTLRIDREALATTALECLLARASDPGRPGRRIEIETPLVVRQSTAPARKSR